MHGHMNMATGFNGESPLENDDSLPTLYAGDIDDTVFDK